MWRKLHVWVEQVRDEQAYDRWVERWQWLADRLEEHEQELEAVEPAYSRLPDWKPGR